MFGKLGLLGAFGLLVLCLCVVAGVGFYLNWFTFSASSAKDKNPDVHLSVNKNKVKEDIKIVEEDVKYGAGKVVEKVHSLTGEKTFEGPIQHIDAAKQQLTFLDKQKKDVTIQVDAATKIKIADKDGAFSDLAADDTVTVKYEAKKDGNVAKTITVQKKS